jgi:hypothetical protein
MDDENQYKCEKLMKPVSYAPISDIASVSLLGTVWKAAWRRNET